MSQIKALDPYCLMAWGAQKFMWMTDGGLIFQVNGLKCKKAQVTIKYDWGADTYKVSVTKNEKVLLEQEDVHFPELVTVLDPVIEGKSRQQAVADGHWG